MGALKNCVYAVAFFYLHFLFFLNEFIELLCWGVEADWYLRNTVSPWDYGGNSLKVDIKCLFGFEEEHKRDGIPWMMAKLKRILYAATNDNKRPSMTDGGSFVVYWHILEKLVGDKIIA